MLWIGQKCRHLNNFNAVMEILAGLQNSAVYRLKKTWNVRSRMLLSLSPLPMYIFLQLLPSKTWDTWEELTHIMSSEDNFRVFREVLHNINPPCIPYLGRASVAISCSPARNLTHPCMRQGSSLRISRSSKKGTQTFFPKAISST